jgi:hypothetical protein
MRKYRGATDLAALVSSMFDLKENDIDKCGSVHCFRI